MHNGDCSHMHFLVCQYNYFELERMSERDIILHKITSVNFRFGQGIIWQDTMGSLCDILFTNLSSRLACYTIYDLSELTVWPLENVQYWYIFAVGESLVLHLTDRFIYTELDFDTKPLALAIRCRGLGCSYFNVADDYCNRFTNKKIYLCIMTSIMCWKYIRAWNKT